MSDTQKYAIDLNKESTLAVAIPLKVEIKAENGSDSALKVIGTDSAVKYKAVASETGGKYKWTVKGKIGISGSDSAETVELKGKEKSKGVDDCTLTVAYELRGKKVSTSLKLTVASVVIKAENGTDAPIPLVGKDRFCKYKCILDPKANVAGYALEYKWSAGGKSSVVAGTEKTETTQIKGVTASGAKDDEEITCEYSINKHVIIGKLKVSVLELKYLETESDVYSVWDPKLADAPAKVTVVFEANIDPGKIDEKGQVIDGGGAKFADVSAKQSGKKFTIEWKGTDAKGKKAPVAKYKVKLVTELKKQAIHECESEEIKIVRIGVTELSFKDNYELKFHDDIRSSGTWNTINADIPSPQWKIASLDDGSGNPVPEPAMSKDQPSATPDTYSYPACYKMGSRVKFKAKVTGDNYESGDNIKVNVNAKDASKFGGSGNENVAPGNGPEFTAAASEKLADKLAKIENYVIDFYYSYKHKDGKWKELGRQKTKNHVFYTIFDKPKAPWVAERPWVSVLEKLCNDWVKNETDMDSAMSAITRKFFASGFKYETAQGASKYTSGGANALLKACLNFLAGKDAVVHKGKLVNCTDCGTMVTSFSNALGCELWSSRFGFSFGCHKIISIGIPGWDYPFSHYHGGTSGGFSYHEIAWKGGCGVSDEVFDACLKVANDPVGHPATNDMFVVNMKYSDYEPRIVIPADVGTVKPAPGTKVRRPVI